MSISHSVACPMCRETGHDSGGNHLLVFEDQGMYCGRSHYHKDGKPYYCDGDSDYIEKLLAQPITGEIRYSVSQFKELVKGGKLKNPTLRAIALSGMKASDRWAVGTDEEKSSMLESNQYHKDYFDKLPVRNLTSRGLRGDICRLFDVHVGVDEGNKVVRHYYPVHNLDLSWRGAKCRTLPKDFSQGTLGFTWGETALFGMHVSAIKGGRKKKLLVVGGELDALAAYQMLTDNDTNGNYQYHVWSPTHGETAMNDIINNKESIDQFETIIWAFDDDSVGRSMNLQASRLFRGKSKFLIYPKGCKDANACLLEGRQSEFLDSWFAPVDSYGTSTVKSVADLAERAKKTPDMGLHWFTPELNKMTLGIRENMLMVIGAGVGVGKTHFTKEVCFHLMDTYKVAVGVLYLEEPPIKTLRSYAGRFSNGKRFDLPPNDPDDRDSWVKERDYTEEEACDAIDRLCEDNLLYIGDTNGDKSIDAVMKAVDDMMAMGIKFIVIDNLTAITHPKAGSKVDALDETMKAIGTYKDENPVTIFLISHLKRVGGDGSSRTPHNHGGEVFESDFRGSNSITAWANYVLSIERNTIAKTEHEKRITTVRCLKDRDFGMHTGSTVKLFGCPETGKLIPFKGELPKSEAESFDMGDY